MRTIILGFCLWSLNCHVNAQIVVEATRLTGVYRGAPMGFSIVVDSFGCENILVKALNGTIRHETEGLRNCRYSFTPGQLGDASIEVWIVDGSDTQKVAERRYRVRSWPTPVAELVRTRANDSLANNMVDLQGIRADIPNGDIPIEPIVRSFQVILLHRGEPVGNIRNKGGRFEQQTKELLNKAKQGDFVLFEDIKVAMPLEPAERKINSLTWRVR